MANQWFRLYAEFSTDPKVQSMSEAMQRRLIMIMCIHCGNGLVTLQPDEISVALRISNDELDETKALFMRKGFVDEQWNIVNWDKRQYVSDSSAARVARHRENKKRDGNVTVTPPDTDTDTDTDKTKTKGKPRFDPFGIELPSCIPSESWAEWIAYRRERKLATSKATVHKQIARLAEWHKSGHDPTKIIAESIANGWQGLFEPKSNLTRTVHDERKEWLDKALGKRNERDITAHATRLD